MQLLISDNNFKESLSKDFNEDEVINGLAIAIVYLEEIGTLDDKEIQTINKVRHSLEKILFNEEFSFNNIKSYFGKLTNKDRTIADKIYRRVKELQLQ